MGSWKRERTEKASINGDIEGGPCRLKILHPPTGKKKKRPVQVGKKAGDVVPERLKG